MSDLTKYSNALTMAYRVYSEGCPATLSAMLYGVTVRDIIEHEQYLQLHV